MPKHSTTIIMRIGYTHLAIPYTNARIAALTDFMENCSHVSLDWDGKMKPVAPEDVKDILFSVIQQDIPVYIAPIETETNEEN